MLLLWQSAKRPDVGIVQLPIWTQIHWHPRPTEDFHCGPNNTQSPATNQATNCRYRAPKYSDSPAPHLSTAVLTASLYWYILTGDGLGWAGVGARDQSSSTNLFPEKWWEREKERPRHTSQSLIRQAAGEGEAEHAIQGAPLQPILATKTELPPVSPESLPLCPQGRSDFLYALWAAQAPPIGSASSYLTQGLLLGWNRHTRVWL